MRISHTPSYASFTVYWIKGSSVNKDSQLGFVNELLFLKTVYASVYKHTQTSTSFV